MKNLIDSEQLKHNGNEVLTWQQNNISLKSNDADDVRVTRSSDEKKITGFTAILLALYEYKADQANPKSTYNFTDIKEIKI